MITVGPNGVVIPNRFGELVELVGEGGYEGLSMFMVTTITGDGPGTVGFIVPSDVVLPFPEPPAAE